MMPMASAPAAPWNRGPFRLADQLVVADGASLPDVCVLTGEPLFGTGRWRTLRMVWTPPESTLLSLARPGLEMALGSLILQKRGRLFYRISVERARWKVWRIVFGVVLFITAIKCYVAGLDPNRIQPEWMVAAGVFFLAGMLSFRNSSGLKVTGYSNGWFHIKGCSPKFLSTLPSFSRGR